MVPGHVLALVRGPAGLAGAVIVASIRAGGGPSEETECGKATDYHS